MRDPRKILLLRPDKAGDAIKSLPAIRALLQLSPELAVSVALSRHNDTLFAFEPGIQTLSYESLITSGSRLQFDHVVSLVTDTFSGIEHAFERVSSPRFTVSGRQELSSEWEPRVARVRFREGTAARKSESENIATLLENALGVDLRKILNGVSAAPVLSNSDLAEAREVLGAKSGAWLGLAPLAGLPARTLPLRRWVSVLQKILRSNAYHSVFLFGGPGDDDRLNEIRGGVGLSQNIKIVRPSSFRTLGAFLKRLDAFIGVDSGPLHYAIALDIPSFGVLAGGDVERWFSRLPRHSHLLRRGVFDKYPFAWEIQRAYSTWRANANPI